MVGRVCQPVHNRICQCGFSNVVVPFFDSQLRGDDDRLLLIPVIKQCEKRESGIGIHLLQSKVIEDNQVVLVQMHTPVPGRHTPLRPVRPT